MRKKLFNIARKHEFWLVLIVLLGFVARLYKLDSPIADWHSWRQADTASVSRSLIEGKGGIFSPRYHDISSIQSGIYNPNGYRLVEFPIFNILHIGLVKLDTPLSFEAAGRLVSVIASTISIVLVYLIGGRYLGKTAGLFSAFFFAFIPFNIYFSRVILPEPLAVTFSLFSIWFYMLFIDKRKSTLLYLSGIFLALAMLIKPFTLLFASAHLFLFLTTFGFAGLTTPKTLIRHLVFASLTLIPFFGWRVIINLHPSGIPFFEWAFNGDNIRFRPAFWRWLFGERIGKLIFGVWGIVPFAVGVLVRSKKNYINLSLLAGSLLYMTLVATASVRHDYYQIFIIPAVSVVAGAGSYFLMTNKSFNRYLGTIVMLFSIGLMLIMGTYSVKDFYQINHPEIIEAGKIVDQLVPPEALVIAPYNGDTAFLYHTKRWGWPAVDDSIENIVKKGATYYVSVTPWDSDTKYVQEKYETIIEHPQYVIVDLKAKRQ